MNWNWQKSNVLVFIIMFILQAIGKIIRRDFFPDLPKLEAQLAFIEATESNDVDKLREISERYPTHFKTPSGQSAPDEFKSQISVYVVYGPIASTIIFEVVYPDGCCRAIGPAMVVSCQRQGNPNIVGWGYLIAGNCIYIYRKDFWV